MSGARLSRSGLKWTANRTVNSRTDKTQSQTWPNYKSAKTGLEIKSSSTSLSCENNFFCNSCLNFFRAVFKVSDSRFTAINSFASLNDYEKSDRSNVSANHRIRTFEIFGYLSVPLRWNSKMIAFAIQFLSRLQYSDLVALMDFSLWNLFLDFDQSKLW